MRTVRVGILYGLFIFKFELLRLTRKTHVVRDVMIEREEGSIATMHATLTTF